MAVAQTDVPRIDTLARPKRLPPEYKDDRRSVYWVEREPLRGGSDGHTVFIATPRVVELARHRNTVPQWTPHRPTPMWSVSGGAMSASASGRLVALSQHKEPHQQYTFDRYPEWDIRRSTLGAQASSRLEQLAMPKSRTDTNPSFEPYWGHRYPVSELAMKAKATERLDALAQHNDYHKEFKNERPVKWEVSKEAIEAIASLRLQQMARPRSRTLIKDDYDPYKIAPSARKARATPRLEELALPIPRKVRTKIITSKAS